MKRLYILLIVFALLMSSCSVSSTEVPQSKPIDPNSVPEEHQQNSPVFQSKAEEILSAMTLEEKVGQLFFIRPDSLSPSLDAQQVNDPYLYGITDVDSDMLTFLRQYPAGGIVFFGKNLTDPDRLSSYMDQLNAASPIPLTFAIDEEGGGVSRIAESEPFQIENCGPMGNRKDQQEAYEAGNYIGSYLGRFGFTLDFAPVADVNSNPDNIVIGNRAFGSDPHFVSRMVSSFLQGLHDKNIAGCLKHFPGHGDTSGDTHNGYVSVTKTWEQLEEAELIPFVDNLSSADLVMVAHLTLPNITEDGLPASLSKELITGKLKGELSYTGLIVTDALAMGAIHDNYSSADAALLAFDAGADILLMPYDYREAFDSVRSAVLFGIITEDRLDESVLKILEFKERYGLI
ncbi:MAG: glycoside hydrolase family 3 protein [Oscillospiraceae bacterium]|nr:glycoside hydrolase family 3 protein [Oscillospiraceae bacterium]